MLASPHEGVLPNYPPQNLTIATTGASGSVFLRHLLLAVERDQRIRTVNFIASDSGLRVLAEELGITGRANLIGRIFGRAGSVAMSVSMSAWGASGRE